MTEEKKSTAPAAGCPLCDARRETAAAAIHSAAVSEWALAAWRGESVSDFAESFPDVRNALDGRAAVLSAIRELRQQVEDTLSAATVESDADNWITAYHFKTGAIHRLLAKAREPLPFSVGEVFLAPGDTSGASPAEPAPEAVSAAPANPKSEIK